MSGACEDLPVRAPDLTPEEVAALPPRRPRWACHLVAMALLVPYLAVVYAEVVLDVRDAFAAGSVVMGVALLPLYHRVGLSWPNVLWFVLWPPMAAVVCWRVGFRLTALPYRDWRSRKDDYDRLRRVPGTPYHVVVGRKRYGTASYEAGAASSSAAR